MNELLPRLSAALEIGDMVSVLVLGDSIARGDEASTPSRGFVSLCADELHNRYGSRVAVTNMSQGGNTAKDALTLLRMRRNPDTLVLVAVGINDAANRTNPRSFERSINKIVRQAAGASDVLLVSPCVPSPEGNIEVYRAILGRQWCAFADVTSVWRARGSDAMLRNDINHPDDAGHRLYAETILSVLHSSAPTLPSSIPPSPPPPVSDLGIPPDSAPSPPTPDPAGIPPADPPPPKEEPLPALPTSALAQPPPSP